MYNFKYEIKTDEEGNNYIDLPTDFDDIIEHRFMFFYMTNYLLTTSLMRLQTKKNTSIEDEEKIITMIGNIEAIINEINIILNDKNTTNLNATNVKKYDFFVMSYDELLKLKFTPFCIGDTIHKRYVGMKVLVMDDNVVYELVNGIENSNWKKI